MKKINSIMLATTVALISAIAFAGCAPATSIESAVSTSNASARTLVEESKTITSDLNPGYGNAVYFTGDFEEGKNWTVAIRGTYEDGQWVCNVTSDEESFEYKALIGSWEEGETVDAVYAGLTKIGTTGTLIDYNTMLSGVYAWPAKDIAYGQAVYFKKYSNNYAVRGEYVKNKVMGYKLYISEGWVHRFGYGVGSFEDDCDVYVGSYDLGETLSPEFVNLTWEAGENHIYK